MEDLAQTSGHLEDQNTLLKAQMAAGAGLVAPPLIETHADNKIDSDEHLRERVRYLEMQNLEARAELESLRKDQDDLLELLTDQEIKLNTFKGRLIELGEDVDDGESDNVSVDSNN